MKCWFYDFINNIIYYHFISGVGLPDITHWSIADFPSPIDKSDRGSWITGWDNDSAFIILTYFVLCDVGPTPTQFIAATLNIISCPVGKFVTSYVVSVTCTLCHLTYKNIYIYIKRSIIIYYMYLCL